MEKGKNYKGMVNFLHVFATGGNPALRGTTRLLERKNAGMNKEDKQKIMD